jgi:hypothetical protein
MSANVLDETQARFAYSNASAQELWFSLFVSHFFRIPHISLHSCSDGNDSQKQHQQKKNSPHTMVLHTVLVIIHLFSYPRYLHSDARTHALHAAVNVPRTIGTQALFRRRQWSARQRDHARLVLAARFPIPSSHVTWFQSLLLFLLNVFWFDGHEQRYSKTSGLWMPSL